MSARFQELDIDQLVPHPQNVRRDVGNVVDMANSISTQGILSPLLVTPHPDEPEKYLIIAGHCRRAAAVLANLDVLPCIVDASLDTLGKQLTRMLVENTQRMDLTPLEEAAGYQQVLDLGVHSVKSVAKETGRSQSLVRKRLLLNKLTDEAKVKLEDRTLNVDQALVLVDFADNEVATEILLNAAANGRDWNFTVNSETRKRDAPAKVEAFEKELEELRAKFVPDKDRYMGKWNIIRDSELTAEEHVAAGHHAIIDRHWGKLEWYEKPPATPKAKKPELTAEEIEAKRRDAQLDAALQIAHAVRAEHLKQVIKTPPEGAADEALDALLLDGIHAHTALYAEITGTPANEKDGHAEIKKALIGFTIEQKSLVLHLTRKTREDELLKLWAWDTGDYRHHYGAKEWLQALGTVYHYELSSVEQEVLDHFAALADTADEDQEEDYEDD